MVRTMSNNQGDGIIKNSINKGEINLKIDKVSNCIYTGGIIADGKAKTTLRNVYNKGNIKIKLIEGNYIRAGGILGEDFSGTTNIANGYNYGKIEINSNATSKLIGAICGVSKTNTNLQNLYYLNNNEYSEIGLNNATSVQIEQIDENNKNGLVDKLNKDTDKWKPDTKNINNGYPILEWQQ